MICSKVGSLGGLSDPIAKIYDEMSEPFKKNQHFKLSLNRD